LVFVFFEFVRTKLYMDVHQGGQAQRRPAQCRIGMVAFDILLFLLCRQLLNLDAHQSGQVESRPAQIHVHVEQYVWDMCVCGGGWSQAGRCSIMANAVLLLYNQVNI
jgi:hypothetical protein